MIRYLGESKQWGLCILCALAFLLLGFAHRPSVVEAGPIPASEIAAYVLPDGSVPVLCLPSRDGTAKHHGHDSSSFCETCRLASSIVLPKPADTLGAPMLRAIAHVPSQGGSLVRPAVIFPGTSARGPPFLINA